MNQPFQCTTLIALTLIISQKSHKIIKKESKEKEKKIVTFYLAIKNEFT